MEARCILNDDCSDIVNVDLFFLFFLAANEIVILSLEELSLVDLDVFRDLAKLLQLLCLLIVVLEDDVRLVIAEVAQTKENDVSVVDPHPVLESATDGAHALDTVEAEGLEAAVAQHTKHLPVLLSLFLEDELTLLVLSEVLSLLPLFTSLSSSSRHC